MSARLKGLQRIKALQKTLADLAAFKLAAAERAKAETLARQEALEAFIAAKPLTGALAGLAGRSVARLAAQAHEADLHRASRAGKKIQAETRLKLVDRVVTTLGAEERDAEERRRLDALIEAMLAAAATD